MIIQAHTLRLTSACKIVPSEQMVKVMYWFLAVYFLNISWLALALHALNWQLIWLFGCSDTAGAFAGGVRLS